MFSVIEYCFGGFKFVKYSCDVSLIQGDKLSEIECWICLKEFISYVLFFEYIDSYMELN